MGEPLLRFQDKDGRGPFRPGFSVEWLDDKPHCTFASIYQENPRIADLTRKAHLQGMHVGCAVRGKTMLDAWFSSKEQAKLLGFGFRIADASGLRVLAETRTQVLIASMLPLKFLPTFTPKQECA